MLSCSGVRRTGAADNAVDQFDITISPGLTTPTRLADIDGIVDATVIDELPAVTMAGTRLQPAEDLLTQSSVSQPRISQQKFGDVDE